MNDILKQYVNDKVNYQNLKSRVEQLLTNLLFSGSDKTIHLLSSRVKEYEKLEEKILRKNGKYSNIKEITDIVGFRVITFFEDEIDNISSIIESEFVVDRENSIDKRKVDYEKFGYQSLHYIVSINESRLKLKEYASFEGIKFEIQIRTILQHSWAEIEHKLGYKSKVTLPNNSKRAFSRIAALLELADSEFLRVRNSIDEYKQSIPKLEITELNALHFDQVSLNYFIHNDKNYIELEEKIAQNTKIILEDDNIQDSTFYVERFDKLGISNLEELRNYLILNRELIIKFSALFRDSPIYRDENGVGRGFRGLILHELIALIASQQNKIQEVYGGHMPYMEMYKRTIEE